MNPNEPNPESKPERKPETQPSVPPPRPPGGKVTSLGAEDPDPGPGGRRDRETMRINLPAKPTAAPTVKVSTTRYLPAGGKPSTVKPGRLSAAFGFGVFLVCLVLAGIIVNTVFRTPNTEGGGAAMMFAMLVLAVIFKATFQYLFGRWRRRRSEKANR